MKTLITILLLGISFTMHAQSCFSDKSDVMSYVVWKTFESKDGNIRIEFSSSQATLRAGGNTYSYMYDNFAYLGSGYKGSIEMTELNGNGGLKMFVSCKERMMTDNKGTLLYEQ